MENGVNRDTSLSHIVDIKSVNVSEKPLKQPCVVGRIMLSPEDVHVPIFGACDNHTWQRRLADVIKLKSLEVGRLSWIIQVDPISSHASSKVENLSWL